MGSRNKGLQWVGIVSLAAAVSACGKGSDANNNAETSGTTTELAVSTVGGAVASTSGDSVAFERVRPERSLIDLLVPKAYASFTQCPTAVSANGGSCSVAGQSMTLTFPNGGCVYNGAIGAIWTGGTELTTGASDSAPACGTYPALNGSTHTSLTRTYLGNLNASPSTRTNAAGLVTIAIDTSAPTVSTFASAATASPSAGTIGWEYDIQGGGGYERTFVSTTEHHVTISARLVEYRGSSTGSGKVLFDHTLSTTDATGASTPLDVSLSGSGNSQTQTVNGTLHLQHNLMKMTASAKFDSVVHEKNCCYPVSGTVTTTFAGGVNDGKQESMVFSGATCTLGTLGEVQFTDIDGNTGTKTLTHCL